jgi:hypothetical protein
MLWIWEDAPYAAFGGCKRQLASLKARSRDPGWTAGAPETPAAIERLVDRLYTELTVMDTKAGALTQASSVLLFVASFPLVAQTGFDPAGTPFRLILFSFMVLFFAVLLCLSVVFLHWFQFEKPIGQASDDELIELIKIRNGRTRRYRMAWILTFVGAFLIAAGYILSGMHRLPVDVSPSVS